MTFFSNMPPWKKNLVALWVSQILSIAGFSGIMPFIPLYFRDRFLLTDEKECGMWIATLTFFGFLSFCIAQPIWGWLSDRYGRKLMLLRAFYSASILFPLLYFAQSLVWFIALRFLASWFSGTTSAAQTLVAATTPTEHQGVALGTLSSAIWSGNMLGFLMGGLVVSRFGYFCGFLLCGVMYLTGALIVQFCVHETFVPPVKTTNKTNKPRFFSRENGFTPAVTAILILFVFMGLARRLDEPYIALLISNTGGIDRSITNTAWISAVSALGGFFSGVITGKLADRFSPIRIAIPAAIIAAFTMALQAAAGNVFLLGAARFCHFFAAGGLEPAFQTMLARSSPPDRRGAMFGIASGMRIFGILLAATCSGGIIFFAGIKAVFLTSGALFLLLIPIIVRAMRSRPENTQKTRT